MLWQTLCSVLKFLKEDVSKSKTDLDAFSKVALFQQIVKFTLELWFQVFTCFMVADESEKKKKREKLSISITNNTFWLSSLILFSITTGSELPQKIPCLLQPPSSKSHQLAMYFNTSQRLNKELRTTPEQWTVTVQ